jgi:hypothetical protein
MQRHDALLRNLINAGIAIAIHTMFTNVLAKAALSTEYMTRKIPPRMFNV